MADAVSGTLTVDLVARTAQFTDAMNKAPQDARAAFAKIKSAASEANEGVEETGAAAVDVRHSFGLLDNAIRGNHAAAMTDLIRLHQNSALVMKALPFVATIGGFALLGGAVAEAYRKIKEEADSALQAQQKFAGGSIKAMEEAQAKALELDLKFAKLSGDDGSVAALEKRLVSIRSILQGMAIGESLQSQLKDLADSFEHGWTETMDFRSGDPGYQNRAVEGIKNQLALMQGLPVDKQKAYIEEEIQRQSKKLEEMRYWLPAKGTGDQVEAQERLVGALQQLNNQLRIQVGTLGRDLPDAAKSAKDSIQKIIDISDETKLSHLYQNSPLDAINLGLKPEFGGANIPRGPKLEDLNLPYYGSKPVYSGSAEAMSLEKIKGDQEAAIQAAQRVTQALGGENQKWNEQYAILVELYNQGRLTDAEFTKGMQQVQAGLLKTDSNWKDFGSHVGQTLEQGALFGRKWQDALKAIAVETTELILKMTLLKKLQGAGGGSGGSGSGGGIGGFLSGLLGGFTGGHATGGEIGPGQWGIVGERGPEPVFGGVRGMTVFPNSTLRGGGGGDQYHFHIDARGADEAAVEMRVRRAVQAAHAQAVSSAMKAQNEYIKRTPRGGRGM